MVRRLAPVSLYKVSPSLPSPQRQHRTLNSLLNEEVANCSGARGPHPHLAPHSYIPITYTHTYQTDTSFPGPNGRKVRVSRDTDPRKATSEVIAVVQKETVKSLHVYSPRESFDWRVSVNTETPCEFAGGKALRYRLLTAL